MYYLDCEFDEPYAHDDMADWIHIDSLPDFDDARLFLKECRASIAKGDIAEALIYLEELEAQIEKL